VKVVWTVQEGEVVMGEIRRWSVEAKEFEISIKGGLLGVRIVEKRNNRQRFICVHRDELPWLVGAVEKAANVDTLEVFWDQSRAGYIRLITQRRANMHGRFLTIEEFDGSRRSGSVLIPEGWSGQGWSRLISELRLACASLKVSRGFRMDKPKLVTAGKRSLAEVVGDSKGTEKKGSSLLKPITGAVLIEGKVPASEGDRREKVLPSIKPMLEPTHTSLGSGGYLQQPQTSSGMNQEVGGAGFIRWSSVWPSEMQGDMSCNPRGSVLGDERQGTQGKVKGRMEGSFNAKQELGGLREWLRQLRSEVDAGLVRVDVVIKKMEGDGPGQIKKKKVWISKPKPKRMFRLKEKRLNSFGKGVGVGPGPMAQSDGAGPAEGNPVVYSKPILFQEGEGSSAGRGTIEGMSQKPKSHIQLGGEKATGLGLIEGMDRNMGNLGGLGSMEETIRSGGGGNPNSGSDDIISVILESIPAMDRPVEGDWREAGCAQRPPMGRSVNSEPQRVPLAAPVSGSGANRGDRGLVSRPECSWVAGRTGFGPVHTGEVVGSPVLVAISEKEVATSERVVSVQNVIDPIVDRGDEAIPGGEEKVAQVCSLETTAVLEVYRRRDAPSQWNLKLRHSDSGDFIEGDMAETSIQGGAYDQGVGQSSVEYTLVESTLEKSMEVSDIAGLSWDGQEGRKEECLRRIVVDITKIGCGGDTDISDFQQAANSMGRFWGNCSDDEA
jgi:hypothetical protein